jgi:DNA-binding CsgD family transcriptional regulator
MRPRRLAGTSGDWSNGHLTDLPTHRSSPAELKARIEAERTGDPFLLYADDGGRQRILVLDAGDVRRLTIGRDPAADVSLEWDSDVSRLHAELEKLGGYWTVLDDGLSRNGTFVNGQRLRGRRRLVDRDHLRFGTTTMLYRAPVAGVLGTTSLGVDASGAALSPAQRRVLVALARPYAEGGAFATPASNTEIAAELVLSVAAVKTHLRSLAQKFGIGDLPQNRKRARLVELAFQSGEITDRDLVRPM